MGIPLSYKTKNAVRAFKSWGVPWFKGKVFHKEFRPILSCFFTEWKCNIDCHYCFQSNSKKPGMDFKTAKKAIDWLKTTGCRVFGIVGGEPLVRPEFVRKVTEYGSKNGFFVYLATNGYLLTPEVVDDLGKAGIAAINLAIDCVTPKKGLPKCFMAVEKNFRYLVKQRFKYGYIPFLNVNLTSKNLKDARLLADIAHANQLTIDFHANEPPILGAPSNTNAERENEMFVKPEQYEEFDELIDWLKDKVRAGYPIVNHISHLERMKGYVRGENRPWDCPAGTCGIFIGEDGSLAPCFGLQEDKNDWGKIWDPKFDKKRLDKIKRRCNKHCLSTTYYSLGCYDQSTRSALKWVLKHFRKI